MSLVGFRARNHPQQVGKVGAKDTIDERITPDAIFDHYNARHAFTLDAAASARNAKCAAFFSLERCGLSSRWSGVVWCNPPYSNIGAWVQKAITSIVQGDAERVVLLLPANRTEQVWWQTLVEPARDGRSEVGAAYRITTEFLARRLNFGTPDNPAGKYKSSAPFGCVVLVVEGR